MSEYDGFIKRYCIRYLGRTWDCLYYKAQLYQESLLNPKAVSPVGAEGIAQFMPDTWAMLATEFGIEASPNDPRYAIQLGALYTRRQYDQWTAPRSVSDRKKLALASYNCGLGCVLRAQRRAAGAAGYDAIAIYLPEETVTYNVRITQWRQEMIDSEHVL